MGRNHALKISQMLVFTPLRRVLSSHGFVAFVALHVKSVHQIHQIELDLVKAMEVTVVHELFQVRGIILDK